MIMKKLKLLDTFAGIGGFSYAAEKIVGGYETTQFIEIEPYCQKVLKKHWSHVPIHNDIRTFTAKPFQYDAICGGFPCQDISIAGLQKGITEETRSGLFFELMRVIRMVRPQYVVLENVAAIINRGLDIVLRELSEAGYDAEWSVISASSVGACHQRNRWWLVAYPNSKQSSGTESEIQAGRIFSSSSTRSKNVANTEGIRGNGRKFNNNTEQGKEKKYVGGYNSDKFTYSDSKGMERRKFTIPKELQNAAYTWESNTPHLSPEWQSYVSKSVLCRGDDGLRNRVDRLKALGNAVVPQVAAIPMQRVLDIEKNINK